MTDQNTSQGDGQPSGRPVLTPRQAALTAGKFHLLAGTACVALFVVFELPSVHFAFVRVGWWLAPWRDFPPLYDRADFSWVHGSLGVVSARLLVILIAFSSMLVLVHGAAFRVTALLHRWLGWPRYWPDVSGTISLRTAWAESARRSWWFWPVILLIWELLTELAAGLRSAMYPVIADSQPFLIANIATIVLGYCYTGALALRAQVAMLIGPEERRCVMCGYHLRGLQSCRCPECGYAFDPLAKPEFRFKWERFNGRGRCRRFVRVLLPIALLAAPLWVPLAILRVPRTWLQWVPSSLQPGWRVISGDPNAFPIRLDAVCRVRHGEGLCVVLFRKLAPNRGMYLAGYWANANRSGEPPLEQIPRLWMGTGWNTGVGPWDLRCVWAGENLFWLHTPDETYKVEAMLVEDFDGDLSWTEEDAGGKP